MTSPTRTNSTPTSHSSWRRRRLSTFSLCRVPRIGGFYAGTSNSSAHLFLSTRPGDPRSKFTKKNLIKYDKIDSQVADLNGARQDLLHPLILTPPVVVLTYKIW